jgi:hopanoid biosynthesis associated protein HpnK
VRRLIVNADDFGLTPGVNRAILEAHATGIVTSTTLMANGPAFDQAVQLAQTAAQLGVGCHVVLVDGTPVLDPSQVRSLLDHPDNRQFPAPISRFAWRCMRGEIIPEEIEAEVTAQIRRLQSAGVNVTHVDAHKHTHMFPRVLRPMLKAAHACGVKAVRNPLESIRISHFLRPGFWKRWGQLRVLNRLVGNFRRAVEEAGMVTTDGTLGIIATGSLTEPIFRAMLEHIPDGTWELVCHPGYNDADLQNTATRLRESRERELAFLTAPQVRQQLSHNGIVLVSYRDLA